MHKKRKNAFDATKPETYHRFIDEAGDSTFFGKGRLPILNTPGVSKVYMIGMVKYKQPLAEVRQIIEDFNAEVCADPFFNTIPSIQKRIQKGNFYLHANEDPPELRYKFFQLLTDAIEFRLQVVIGRKDIGRFSAKHNGQEKEFYTDLLSRLLFDKGGYQKLILNIASLGNTTRTQTLEDAVRKAEDLSSRKSRTHVANAKIKFNIQPYQREPLLTVADYGLWAVQRVFERGETRFYDSIIPKVKFITDVYGLDSANPKPIHYNPSKPLTKDNQIT